MVKTSHVFKKRESHSVIHKFFVFFMPLAGKGLLASDATLVGAAVRVPARFFGDAFAKSTRGSHGEPMEYLYTVTALRKGATNLREEWTLSASGEDDIFVPIAWMRKFTTEGRTSGL